MLHLTIFFIAVDFFSMGRITTAVQSQRIFDVALEINQFFDLQHPAQYNTSPLLPHHHSKRCTNMENSESIQKYVNGFWKLHSKDHQILVSTPCLGSDSLGNYLGSYFENVVCANMVGMHYVSVAKIWEPNEKDIPSPFLAMLPSVIEHKSPLSESSVKSNLQTMCKCVGSCHERPNAMWIKGLDIIRPILLTALNHHLSVANVTELTTMTVHASDLSSVAAGDTLPLIPDAAIHYRCGDNFVGHYGFMPFSSFKVAIPTTANTIYVLAENRDRKTKVKRHLAAKCDAIFQSMFSYLTVNFPQSKVVIRRGDDLYLDMARLARAKYVLCSVSTFCLWPALINPNKVFFPRTKLIVGGRTDIDLGFSWLETPGVVLGRAFDHSSPAQLIAKLNS